MDLALHLRVLWRFRLVVALGLLAAIALAFFSYVSVDVRNGWTLHYRQQQEYVAYTQILVTQQGFPEGRSVIAPPASGSPLPTAPARPAFADPSRFTSLALLYAKLIDTDPVWRIARRDGPLRGKVETAALPATDSGNGETLPVISVASIAASRQGAIELGRRLSRAFMVYVDGQQAENGVPARNRVELEVVKQPLTAKVWRARSKALPIVVFLSMLFVTSALAFALENMRPRIRSVEAVRHSAAERSPGTAA